MSTVSGFVLGAIAAAGLTVLYGDKLHHSLSEAAALYTASGSESVVMTRPDGTAQESAQIILSDAATPELADITESDATAPGTVVIAQSDATLPEQASPAGMPQIQSQPAADLLAESAQGAQDAQIGLEQRWAEFAAQADTLRAVGDFPWRSCFARAAATYELPETLLLAIASGESNFDPAARSGKDAVGLMQILWPGTSRHLGVVREADLYDPCTNVDAGARYLLELAGQFDNNLHLMVAAYNYGPGRIAPGAVPEGARWYSEYIYRHLQQVLGGKQGASSSVTARPVAVSAGRQLVMSFSGSARARDFMAFLNEQIPELDLQLRSETFGQHDVVLLYRSESERRKALNSISAAGVVPVTAKQYL